MDDQPAAFAPAMSRLAVGRTSMDKFHEGAHLIQGCLRDGQHVSQNDPMTSVTNRIPPTMYLEFA